MERFRKEVTGRNYGVREGRRKTCMVKVNGVLGNGEPDEEYGAYCQEGDELG